MFGRNYQELASTYSAMGAMLEAGVDLLATLTFQEQSGSDKLTAARLGVRIRAGSTLHQALRAERFPPMDVALIKAGEQTGELAPILKLLSDAYSNRAALDRNLKAALAKPVLLFSVAVICTSLPPYVLGLLTTLQFLLLTGTPIALLIAALIAFFKLLWRATRNPELDKWLDQKFAHVPAAQLLSGPIARERFFMSFLICIKAGASLDMLTETLRLVSDHPTLKGATAYFSTIAPQEGLAAALERTRLFSPDIVAGVRVGEQTGRLEQQLQIILKEIRGQIDFKLKVFKEWAPRFIYGAIALFVAANIIVIATRRH